MSKPRKRKLEIESNNCSNKRKKLAVSSVCILHSGGVQQHDYFIPFSKIKGSAPNSPHRMNDACSCIPENIDDINLESHGYHKSCYEKFTSHLNRLKSNLEHEASTSRSPRKSRTSSTVMFPPECIFCDKKETKISGKTERCIKFPVFKTVDGNIKEPSWKQIEPRALEMGLHRLHRKVQGEDLFAKEANFHQSCRKSFNLQYMKHMQKQQRFTANAKQDDHTVSPQQKAFSAVLDFIQDQIIGHREVVTLSQLRKLYTQELENCGFPNADYRNSKLKARLENHAIHDLIAFAVVDLDESCCTYTIVYSANISVADAIAFAYKLGSKNNPDDLDVQNVSGLLPPSLLNFLTLLISGGTDENRCQKSQRVVLSIAQVQNNIHFIYNYL